VALGRGLTRRHGGAEGASADWLLEPRRHEGREGGGTLQGLLVSIEDLWLACLAGWRYVRTHVSRGSPPATLATRLPASHSNPASNHG
jgi:hypothetical protein